MIGNEIQQKKLDGLTARILHEGRLARLRFRIQVVDVTALVVPAAYFPIRYLAKGTQYGAWIEAFWTVTAGALTVLVLLKLTLRWQDRAVRHGQLIGENLSLVSHASQLAAESAGASPSSVQLNLFLHLANAIERQDRDALSGATAQEKRNAYREALKELLPSDTTVTCPVCGASPWQYNPGSCQACGNTPTQVQDQHQGDQP